MSSMQDADLTMSQNPFTPVFWKKDRLKTIASRIETGRRPPDEPEEVLSIGGEHIQDGKFCLASPKFVSAQTFASSRGKIALGDLLVVKDGATIGKCMYVEELPYKRMLLNEHVYRIPIEKFFYYWMMSTHAQGWFRSQNMSTAQESIPLETIFSLPILVPPPTDRKRIVAFLDEKTAAIDKRIALLERKRDTLKRLKKSVIHHAVTRGLDPNVPLKESGVEWIGKIPEKWALVRIKDLVSVCAGATPDTKDDHNFDGSVVWVTPADFKTSDHYVSGGRRNLSELGLQNCSAVVFPAKSLILSKRAPVGTVAISTIAMATNQGCLTCVPSGEVDINFLYYSLATKTALLEAISSGSTFLELSADAFKNTVLAIPSLPEQGAIADYLDAECAKIDAMATTIEKQINACRRLKRALIDEVVTGRRAV